MSLRKIETVRDTEHRLFALSDEGSGLPLAVGRAKPLAEGVTLTLADQAGNAMVEIGAGKRGAVKVTVDGAEVFEIAHCKPGQKIEVDGEAFVVLAPFGIFVQPRVKASEPVAAPKARRLPAPKAKKKRSALLLVAATLVCAAGVGLAMMPSHEDVEAPAQEVVEAKKKPAPPKKKVVQVAPKAAEAPKAEAAPAPEPAPAAVPEPAKPTSSLAASPAPAPKPTPDKSPKPPKAKTTPAPEKPALKALSPEREASVRKQIESYQLEAGFDPDAAAAKLRKLKAELPADAAIRAEVDNALKGLPQ